MTRGNQRDLAREKAKKKQTGKGIPAAEQGANKGMTKEQRQQRDADRMREKQKKAQDGTGKDQGAQNA